MNVKTQKEIDLRFERIKTLKPGWHNSKGKHFPEVEREAIFNAMIISQELLFIDEINCEYFNSVELHYMLNNNFVNFSVHSDNVFITASKTSLLNQDIYYPRYNKKFKLANDSESHHYLIDFLNACIIYYLNLTDRDIYNINPSFVVSKETLRIMQDKECRAKIVKKVENCANSVGTRNPAGCYKQQPECKYKYTKHGYHNSKNDKLSTKSNGAISSN